MRLGSGSKSTVKLLSGGRREPCFVAFAVFLVQICCHGHFQAAKMMSLNSELGREVALVSPCLSPHFPRFPTPVT